MSIDGCVENVEQAARAAVLRTRAVEPCPVHQDVLIRVGDPAAERHAYALARTIFKSDGTMFMREDLMLAIKDELELAADGECPACSHFRDE
jgi:hypothetical protein